MKYSLFIKTQLLTVTLIHDTYNFEQLHLKNISHINWCQMPILLKIIGKEERYYGTREACHVPVTFSSNIYVWGGYEDCGISPS